MAGLMVVTAFLSMWINNSAAASIMLPVALAISDELSGNRREDHGRHEITTEVVFIVNGKRFT
jgi:di/tricarboxylate transporter